MNPDAIAYQVQTMPRSLKSRLAIALLEVDLLDLEWRAPVFEATFGQDEPEEASVTIWPCDENTPVLFIGAERAASKASE